MTEYNEDAKKKFEEMVDNGELKANLSVDIEGSDANVSIGGHGVAEIAGLAMLFKDVASVLNLPHPVLAMMMMDFVGFMEGADADEAEGMPS